LINFVLFSLISISPNKLTNRKRVYFIKVLINKKFGFLNIHIIGKLYYSSFISSYGDGQMPKNRAKNNQAIEATRKPRIPDRRDAEILGVVTEVLGGEHMLVKAENGVVYMGVIRGKIKKRIWCRLGDLVVIVPWAFESAPKEGKKAKAHIVHRYTRTQQSWLESHGYINEAFQQELQNI
jgi:translation initiation factor 1A